jgi:hypothetical protein
LKVGDGSSIFLWYDTWHPAGCLTEKYGFRTIYDAGHSIGPKLSSIIRNGEWLWKSARSDSLVEIQSRLPEIPIGNADIPVRKFSKGTFPCFESWNLLRLKFLVVEWHRVVWFPLGQSMMPDIVLVLSFPPLLEMESGYGRVLDRIVWWKYKVVYRKFQ